jgi:hypothetical protein
VPDSETINARSQRRSALQLLILIRLAKGPARTIAGLARDLGRERSVVGKSLRRLHGQGLVAREGTIWYLTAAGDDQARGARARLERSFEDAATQASSALSDLTRVGVLASTSAALRKPATTPGSADQSRVHSGRRPTPAKAERAADQRAADLRRRVSERLFGLLYGFDLGARVMPWAAWWLASPPRARRVEAAFGRAELVPGPSMNVGLVRGVVEAYEARGTRDEICGKVLDHYDEGNAAALAGVVERLSSTTRLAGREDVLRQTLQAHKAGLDAIGVFPMVPVIESVAVACVLALAGEDRGPHAAGVVPAEVPESGTGVDNLACLVGYLEAHLYNPQEECTRAADYYVELNRHRLARLRQAGGTRMDTLRCFLLLDLVVAFAEALNDLCRGRSGAAS